MRQPRLKAPETWEVAYYHCVSRVVDRRFAFDEEDKAQFVRLMRLYERLCQVRVVTYCVLSNHFHLLVEVPSKPKVMPSEEELLAHIGRCHGKRRADLVTEQIRFWRSQKVEPRAQAIIDSWLVRMWDLGSFMKTLKQRFTQWHNKRYERRGTLWEDRYRSTIVQGGSNALAMVGTYIDLNPLRAGIVDDPKDYRWSGYGAALAGVKAAIGGVETMVAHQAQSPPRGRHALEKYRVSLYTAADAGDEATQRRQSELPGARRGVSHEKAEAVRAKGGNLSRWEMLRCKVRYFTAGAVIGSREFVNEVFEARRDRFGPNRKEGAKPMKGADFGGLWALRDLQVRVFG